LLAALIIVFREVLEAGLIIGVVLAASRGVPGRGRAVGLGVFAGLVGSVIVALFAAEISQAFAGRGQEIFNASVLLLAVVMLTWHVVWMASHAREMTARLKKLGHAVAAGSQSVVVLGVAVASAVMREGSEVVLFLSGILMQGAANATALALGSAGGLVLGAAMSAVVYTGLMVVPLRRVFTVTGVLVTLLAAGLAAEAVRQLSNAGFVNVLDGTLWDTSWVLSENSWPGRVLHVLIGYMDRPTTIEILAYGATIATIYLLAMRVRPRTAAAKPHLVAQGGRPPGLTDRDAA
jgi:high-affinity iron transporter